MRHLESNCSRNLNNKNDIQIKISRPKGTGATHECSSSPLNINHARGEPSSLARPKTPLPAAHLLFSESQRNQKEEQVLAGVRKIISGSRAGAKNPAETSNDDLAAAK